MNTQEIQGQWNRIRGQVKEKWGQLTDDDLVLRSGNVDQLVGKIQQKTGEGREAIEKALEELTAKGSSGVAAAAETVRDTAAQAASYMHDAGDRVREGAGRMAHDAREHLVAAEDMVRQNPTQSLAAAFGLGLAVGVVVGLALKSR